MHSFSASWPGVAERRVAEVVGQADGLGQHLVELERARDGARDLRDLERMRQAGAVQVALVVDEDLGLVHQPAERGGMHDAVAVALVFGPVGRRAAPAWRRPRDCAVVGRVRRRGALIRNTPPSAASSASSA